MYKLIYKTGKAGKEKVFAPIGNMITPDLIETAFNTFEGFCDNAVYKKFGFGLVEHEDTETPAGAIAARKFIGKSCLIFDKPIIWTAVIVESVTE